MPSDLDRFARNLRAARKARDWSQERLADEAGLHLTAVSRLERGVREPLLTTLARLLRALDAESAELFRGITDKKKR